MSDVIIHNFGENLRKIRKDHNLTLKELALKLGTSPQMLSLYENGEKLPSLYSAIKISNFFNCSIDSLVYTDTDIDITKLKKIDENNDTEEYIFNLAKNLDLIRENSSKLVMNSSKIISINSKLIEHNNKLILDTSKMIERISKSSPETNDIGVYKELDLETEIEK